MKNINFKDNYIEWLQHNIDQQMISSDLYRMTLPFLDRHNDQIELYIKKDGDDFTITDDGYTISDLEMSGLNIFSSPKRTQIYKQILNSHGISESDSHELYVTGTLSELALKKHLMAQCMQKIGDLFYLSHPGTKPLFIEDVQSFLDASKIRYVPDISFIGKSKLPSNYDFAIPKSKNAPQRIIKVVNHLTLDYTRSILFTWYDISEARKDESVLYTFIRDTEKKVAPDAISALKEYQIQPVLWSKRNEFQQVLYA